MKKKTNTNYTNDTTKHALGVLCVSKRRCDTGRVCSAAADDDKLIDKR